MHKGHFVLLMLGGQEVCQKEHKLWCKTELVFKLGPLYKFNLITLEIINLIDHSFNCGMNIFFPPSVCCKNLKRTFISNLFDMKYYSNIKKSKLLIHAKIWVDFHGIRLSEKSIFIYITF